MLLDSSSRRFVVWEKCSKLGCYSAYKDHPLGKSQEYQWCSLLLKCEMAIDGYSGSGCLNYWNRRIYREKFRLRWRSPMDSWRTQGLIQSVLEHVPAYVGRYFEYEKSDRGNCVGTLVRIKMLVAWYEEIFKNKPLISS